MFRRCFFRPFLIFNDEKLRYKYYNKQSTTRENGNAQSPGQEESELNSTILKQTVVLIHLHMTKQ